MHQIFEPQKSFLEITASLRYLLPLFFEGVERIAASCKNRQHILQKEFLHNLMFSLEKALVECHLHSHA